MKQLLKAVLAALAVMILITRVPGTAVSAAEHKLRPISRQIDPTKPMQRGITVLLPVTTHAVTIPEADELDALVVTLTLDGKIYLGERQVSSNGLAEQVKAAVSSRADKTLYIKADARVPYAALVSVVDTVRTTDVRTITLLTSQRDSEAPGAILPTRGFAFLITTAEP